MIVTLQLRMGELHAEIPVDTSWTFFDLVSYLEQNHQAPHEHEHEQQQQQSSSLLLQQLGRGSLHNTARPLYQLIRPTAALEKWQATSGLLLGEAASSSEAATAPYSLQIMPADALVVMIQNTDTLQAETLVLTAAEVEARYATPAALLATIQQRMSPTTKASEARAERLRRALHTPFFSQLKIRFQTAWSRRVYWMDEQSKTELDRYVRHFIDPDFVTIIMVYAGGRSALFEAVPHNFPVATFLVTLVVLVGMMWYLNEESPRDLYLWLRDAIPHIKQRAMAWWRHQWWSKYYAGE